MKISSRRQSEKNKIVIKLLSQPKLIFITENWKNTTKGSNQRLTASLNPSNVPGSNTVCGRSSYTQVWAGRKHLANWYVSHHDTWNCIGCNSGMSNSDRSRWTLTEQTPIHVQITLVKQCSNITSICCEKKLWSGQLPATEYTWRPRSWRWHSAADPRTGDNTQGLTNIKISILWETRETIPRIWYSKVSIQSNFTPRMSRLGLAQMESPDRTKSPLGGFTGLDLLTTKALVLLGFSNMHQWLHPSWIVPKSQLRERAPAGLSAVLRRTASNVESSA